MLLGNSLMNFLQWRLCSSTSLLRFAWSYIQRITPADRSQNYDEIRVSEVPNPIQRDGEVLVRVKAAGLNFVDLLYVSDSELSFQVPSDLDAFRISSGLVPNFLKLQDPSESSWCIMLKVLQLLNRQPYRRWTKPTTSPKTELDHCSYFSF